VAVTHSTVAVTPYAFFHSGPTLLAADISDPANPVEVGRLLMCVPVQDFFLDESDSLLFVAGLAGGLEIVDVSDPFSPVEVAALDTPRGARGVFVSGNTTFLFDRLFGLHIADISEP